MKKLCIYHGNCADGFGAACVVRKALGDDVEFHKGVHGDSPPDVTGRDVILVDFSYDHKIMSLMVEFAKSVIVLDHHKTAESVLEPLITNNSIYGLFDTNKSGAMLAWEWFFPHEDPPALIKHIQDRDLWKFELEGTREISAVLSSYPYDFKVWDRIISYFEIEWLITDGVAILRKQDKDIKELIEAGGSRANIDEFNVPALNAPHMWSSDAGHIMSEGEPFAACYMYYKDSIVFSLRSGKDGVDVSEVAARFGGGGHKHSAGFKIDITEAGALTVNSNVKGDEDES